MVTESLWQHKVRGRVAGDSRRYNSVHITETWRIYKHRMESEVKVERLEATNDGQMLFRFFCSKQFAHERINERVNGQERMGERMHG